MGRHERARRVYGPGMKRKIERELRAAVVAASDQIPGTKAPWVYKLRNGSKSVAGTFSANLIGLKAQGIPIVGVIGTLVRMVEQADDLDQAA